MMNQMAPVNYYLLIDECDLSSFDVVNTATHSTSVQQPIASVHSCAVRKYNEQKKNVCAEKSSYHDCLGTNLSGSSEILHSCMNRSSDNVSLKIVHTEESKRKILDEYSRQRWINSMNASLEKEALIRNCLQYSSDNISAVNKQKLAEHLLLSDLRDDFISKYGQSMANKINVSSRYTSNSSHSMADIEEINQKLCNVKKSRQGSVSDHQYDCRNVGKPSINTPFNKHSRDSREGGAYNDSRAVGGEKSAALQAEDLPVSNNPRKILSVSGLANLGNTCFMNSILQCLMHTRPLLEYCVTGQYRSDINKLSSCMKGQLIQAYVKVMLELSGSSVIEGRGAKGDIVSPHEFKSQIARFANRFLGYSQHDAHEFLMYLLEGLHEDLNKSIKPDNKSSSSSNSSNGKNVSNGKTNSSSSYGKTSSNSSSSNNNRGSVRSNKSTSSTGSDKGKEEEEECIKAGPAWDKYRELHNSKIIDIFVGQLRSTLTCSHCGHSSDTFEPFLDLSLPIGQTERSVSLLDCLQMFLQVEELTGDERPTCARCKCKRDCTKRFSIEKFPQVLIIHLKRFGQGMFSTSKLYTTVKCPHSLNLSNFTRTSDSTAQSTATPAVNGTTAVNGLPGSTANTTPVINGSATVHGMPLSNGTPVSDSAISSFFSSSRSNASLNSSTFSSNHDEDDDGNDVIISSLSKTTINPSSSQVTYRLYAVSNHSGSTQGGHYTASARHPHTSIWHYFNDSRVTTIDEKSVITSDAYILFYELIETTTSRL